MLRRCLESRRLAPALRPWLLSLQQVQAPVSMKVLTKTLWQTYLHFKGQLADAAVTLVRLRKQYQQVYVSSVVASMALETRICIARVQVQLGHHIPSATLLAATAKPLGPQMQKRATKAPTSAQAGGNVEGHLEGLLRIEARVAEGVVAGLQVGGLHRGAPTQALCHIVARHLQVHAARDSAQSLMHIKESLHLAATTGRFSQHCKGRNGGR